MLFYTCFSLSVHPPPAFGSSPNLEALALEATRQDAQDGDSVNDSSHLPRFCTSCLFYKYIYSNS